uniref:dual specificity phosphatase 29-like n=1 Tax=Oncorhynchus gorbuscha TaxID=8017 RepID=UPI001EAE9E87
YAAKDKKTLQAHHITHVLNAADGKFNVNTGYYREHLWSHSRWPPLTSASSSALLLLLYFFCSTANFTKTALSSPNNKPGRCWSTALGLSRPSSLVLTYLMIDEELTSGGEDTIMAANRNICAMLDSLEQ